MARKLTVQRWLWIIGVTGCFAVPLIILHPPKRPTISIEVRRDALAMRDGRLYRSKETVPFTGVISEIYANGTYQSRTCVSNGLLEGLSEGWHTNGNLQIQERFMAGVSHGLRTKWHSNGRILSEANIVNAKMEGWFRRWNEEGALIEEIPMKAGQPDGLARSFFPSGFVKAEVRLSN